MAGELTSYDPATGEAVGRVTKATGSDVEQALAAARDAQAAWAQRPVRERVEVLARFQRGLLDARHEVAELISRESGKPLTEAMMADILPALDMAKYLRKHGPGVLADDRFRLENPLLMDRSSTLVRGPVGVVGIIGPWNYPLGIPASQALTAILAGNGVVLKPSEHTPLVAQRFVSLLEAAGVPDQLVVPVYGAGDVGAALVEASPDLVVFTGSVPVGQEVAQACAARMTPHVLELGGKDPMLVLDDANVGLAARGAVWGAFTNAGQTCAAVERVYVHESVADAFTRLVVEEASALRVGNGLSPNVDMGPLITDDAVDRCEAQVADATKRGAHVATGGSRLDSLGPRFYEPTVLTGVDHAMTVMQDETFGPLLPVQTVADDEEAVTLANDSRYGLSASVWSRDAGRAEALAARLEAGTITLNDGLYTYAACETPWGGIKASGHGHTHGRVGIETMTRLKHVNRARPRRSGSPWYYPYDDDLATLFDDGLEFLYGRKRAGARVLGPLRRRFFGAPERDEGEP